MRCLLEKNALVPPCPHLADSSNCTLLLLQESISAAEDEDEDEKVFQSIFVPYFCFFFPSFLISLLGLILLCYFVSHCMSNPGATSKLNGLEMRTGTVSLSVKHIFPLPSVWPRGNVPPDHRWILVASLHLFKTQK